MSTTVDTLLDAATAVQEWENRVALIEESIIQHKADAEIVEFLKPRRDQRVHALYIHRQSLANSIRAYREATGGVSDFQGMSETALVPPSETITLGDIADTLRTLRSRGATIESIQYALNKVAEEQA